MKNLFGAGATAFLTCLDMAVKSEVEKWPDEEEKPFADSKKIVLRKVHNKGMCMSLLKEYPQFVKYTSLVMAAILTVWDILCLRKKGSYLKKAGLSLGVAGAWSNTLDRWMRGYVVDYIRFHSPWKWLNHLVFNLADFFIFIGSALIVLGKKE